MEDHKESVSEEEYCGTMPSNASPNMVDDGRSLEQLFSTRPPNKKSGRHGARNQHRHKHFTKWLLQTFPHLKSSDKASMSSSTTQRHVLDVAGGKGELAARLCFCHGINVVMVDPRACDIVRCFTSLVLPKLPKKWQQRLKAQQEANPRVLEEITSKRFRQLVTTFDQTTLSTCQDLQDVVQNASLLVGMHADGATEAIVNVALELQRPFVVVPCCVFPRLFAERTIQQQDGSMVQVRTHEQFCQYLLQKDPRLVSVVLPFEGRNVAIWWGGDCSGEANFI
jgi:hypothetical protein